MTHFLHDQFTRRHCLQASGRVNTNELFILFRQRALFSPPLATRVRTGQQRVDDAARGRVMSLFQVAWAGIVPFGGLFMGSMGSAIGVVPTLGIAGAACVLYGMTVAVVSQRLEPEPAVAPAGA